MAVTEPVTVTEHCTCGRCDAKFTIETAIGPSRICGACTARLLAFIWGPGGLR